MGATMNQEKSMLKRIGVGGWVAIVTVTLALFYLGYLLGNIHGIRSVVPEGEARVLNQGSGLEATDDLDFLQFWQKHSAELDTRV
jgi:hypothetical protein